MTLPFDFNGGQPFQAAALLWASLALFVCALLVFNSKRAGPSKIPGLFLARYTDVWSLYVAWKTGDSSNKVSYLRKLQARYGDVIRTGPRSATVIDPAAVPVIYGFRSKLNKVRSSSFFQQDPTVGLMLINHTH